MIKVEKAGIKWWWKLNKNYRQDFPKEERIPFLMLLLINAQGKGEFLVFKEEDGSLAGYAIINRSKKSDWVLINYLAVASGKRSKGYGGQMMKILSDYFKDRSGILLEIEKPGDGDCEADNEIRNRRKAFYLKNNVLPTTAHFYIRSISMELMYYASEKVSDEELLKVHKEIYLAMVGAKNFSKNITY